MKKPKMRFSPDFSKELSNAQPTFFVLTKLFSRIAVVVISILFLLSSGGVWAGSKLKPGALKPPSPPNQYPPLSSSPEMREDQYGGHWIDDLKIANVTIRDSKIVITPALTIHFVASVGKGGKKQTVLVGRGEKIDSGFEYRIIDVLAEFKLNDPFAADSHLNFLPGSPTDAWLTFAGGADTCVYAIPTSDGGKTWDMGNLSKFTEGMTKHEPGVVGNTVSDCLLLFTSIGPKSTSYLVHRVGNDWAAPIPLSGLGIDGISHGKFVLPLGQPGKFQIYVNQQKIKPEQVPVNTVVLDATFEKDTPTLTSPQMVIGPVIKTKASLEATGKFRYEGGTNHVVAGSDPNGEKWMVVRDVTQDGMEILRLKHCSGGLNWDTELPPISATDSHYVSGNLCFDPVQKQFYLFYLKINPVPTNTYDILYQTIPEEEIKWSEPKPLLSGLSGKQITPSDPFSKAIGNQLYSGAVYDGKMAVIYQECDSTSDVGKLKIYRNFN